MSVPDSVLVVRRLWCRRVATTVRRRQLTVAPNRGARSPLAITLRLPVARGRGYRGFAVWSGTMISRYEQGWIWSIATPGAVDGAADRRRDFGVRDGPHRHRVGGLSHGAGQDHHLPCFTECTDLVWAGSEHFADGLGQSVGSEWSAVAVRDV